MELFKKKKFDVQKIREDFPILKRKINGKQLIYLDNTATTQKPVQVIDALANYYKEYNANVHRGVHTLSQEASVAYENAHEKAAKLINAKSEEIIFLRNATEALNLIMYSWALENLKKHDEIIATVMEHHSNIVPWQFLRDKIGVRLKFVDIKIPKDFDGSEFRRNSPDIKDDYTLNLEQLSELITENTKLITVTHVSNVLGTINPVREIGKIAHENNCLFVVDAAASVPKMPVDVKKINADFLDFSGHKMLAPTGIGVLYGKKELLEKMPPFMYGGDMIKEVTLEGAVWNDLPWKFEAGTANVADGIAFGVAVDYLQNIGMENIRQHDLELTKYALEKLSSISGVKIYGPKNPELRTGTISFNVGDAHPHDVASILDEEGIAVRSGHHCAMPLHKRLGIESSCRASFYIYNTKEEVDKLVEGIEKVKKVFKIS